MFHFEVLILKRFQMQNIGVLPMIYASNLNTQAKYGRVYKGSLKLLLVDMEVLGQFVKKNRLKLNCATLA